MENVAKWFGCSEMKKIMKKNPITWTLGKITRTNTEIER